MRAEKEIRLQRLTAMNAVASLIREGQEMLKKEIKTEIPESTPILSTVTQIGVILDTLNWVLGESPGRSMEVAMSQAENLSRYLKTGKFLPSLTKEKSFSLIRKIIKEGPELGKRILKDRKKLLEIDWDELESK